MRFESISVCDPPPHGPSRTGQGSYNQALPYTGSAAPLIARDASDARNDITSAMASGATHLVKSAFGMAARFCGVSITLGMMQFTLMSDIFTSGVGLVEGLATPKRTDRVHEHVHLAKSDQRLLDELANRIRVGEVHASGDQMIV